jgi:transposase
MGAGMTTPYVPEDIAVRLVETHSTMTVKEQAAELQISANIVRNYRALLIKQGRLDPRKRAGNRPYTLEEYQLVEAMLKDGMAWTLIAKKVGREPSSLEINFRKRYGKTIREVRSGEIAVRSQRQVALLFNVRECTVRYWAEMKWLEVRRNPRKKRSRKQLNDGRKVGDRREYLIHDDAILSFLKVRAAWPSYEPAEITDRYWREEAEEIRAAAGGRWVKAISLAPQLCVAIGTLTNWLAHNRWPVETTMFNGWFVWIPDKERLPPTPLELPRRFEIRQYPATKMCRICGEPFLVANSREYDKRTTCGDSCRKRKSLRSVKALSERVM